MNIVKFNTILDQFPSLFFDEYETTPTTRRSFIPPTDVTENETEFELSLIAAGLSKSDFNIKVEDQTLIISGEKKTSEKKYNFKESVHGKFVRKFTLPKEIKVEDISATYTDGVLTVKLPKDKEIVKSKLIEVQ
jgi:HSP20 family protein